MVLNIQFGGSFMKHKVKMSKVMDALEITNPEIDYYYEKKSQEIHILSEMYDDGADEISDIKERLESSPQGFVKLPDQYEINEYEMMRSFCYSLDDEKNQEILLHRIQGRGAFRMFKDSLNEFDLSNSWYAYRADKLQNVAVDWCELNDIELIRNK